ncbi:MAG: glutamyl-tRNA reductase, partial [Pseudomonadales bacterium]
VAYCAVTLAQQIFGDLSQSQALLIGAGETIELVVRHLKEAGVSRLVVANRTLFRAQELTALLGGEAISLSELPHALAQSDLVIASTGSPMPLLGKGTVEEALKVRKHRPIFMMDIAVPRDIEPQVGELRDVYLYTIDDLTAIIEKNLRNRGEAARNAELLIDEGVLQYVKKQRIRDVQDVVRAFRDQAEALQAKELAKARRRLQSGADPQEVMEQLARNLTNKLIHKPTVGIRSAGAEGRSDLIEWLQELFELKPREP